MTHADQNLTYFSYCDAYDIKWNKRGRFGHFGRLDSIRGYPNYTFDQFVHHNILMNYSFNNNY